MIWTVKKNTETRDNIEIGYSYGQNSSCDGTIRYDKEKDAFFILKLSENCDSFNTERLYQFLYGLLSQGKLGFEEYSIRLG